MDGGRCMGLERLWIEGVCSNHETNKRASGISECLIVVDEFETELGLMS
jgi:hypothetical protein